MTDASIAGKPVVGTALKPGDDASEFLFVTPDEGAVKTGEFIAYRESVDEGEETILARVTNREQERGLPETFMADPSVSPGAVAETLGVPSDGVDLYRLTARVIGYYDDVMDSFVNPRSLPAPGTQLRRAPAATLEEVLPNHDGDTDGTATLGWLLNRPQNEVRIHLPVNEYAATHLAILASTGSGKSYAASVLIEEMMQPDIRAALLVFDPHAEYQTLDQMLESEHAEVFQSGDYTPEVLVKPSEDLQIRISDLTFGDLLALIDDPSNRMEHVLNQAWQRLQGQESSRITVDDIIQECYTVDGQDSSTAHALSWRLRRALGSDLFQPEERDRLSDLVVPGQCTVLQMNRLSRREQQMLAAVLLRKLYQEREAAERGDETELDYPIFALMEEGHRFAPDGSARSLETMRTILSEGRKFGFGIGIISQRPSKIDADVLSQCGTQIIMQIQNPNDQDAVRKSVEAAGEDILRELPGLTPGQAVVSGDAVNTPFLCHVRERHTEHGAESPDATTEWQEAWERLSDVEGTKPAYDTSDEDSIEDL